LKNSSAQTPDNKQKSGDWKMKEFILGTLAVLLFAALIVAVVFCGTSAEAWYAGEHTSGCDRSDNCGCYAELIKTEVR
jgi:hypothetical protein